MLSIKRRVGALENARGSQLPRVVVKILSPCDDHRGSCDHITAATVGSKTFRRLPRESVDEMGNRAAASDPSRVVFVMFDGSVNFEPLPLHIRVGKERDENH